MSKKLILKHVRCAFPHVFEPLENKFNGQMEYSIRVVIKKDDAQLENIKAGLKQIFIDKFGPEKGPRKLKAALESKNTRFLHYDDENDWYYLNLKRRSSDGAPVVVDRNKTHLNASAGKPYGGCYINVSFEMWVYDNASCGAGGTLLGLQFVEDGEPFGGASQPNENDFDDLTDTGADDPAPFDDLI